MNTTCLRCQAPCQTGNPDPAKRAIRVADKAGLCANCMITQFLLSVTPIRAIIEGTPRHPGKGPEIFLNAEWTQDVLRPVMKGLLDHTQMPENAIDWTKVVENWKLPFPNKHQPKTDLFS